MSYLPNRKNIPESHNRISSSGRTIRVDKGGLNKISIRPSSVSIQQEQNATPVGTVTGTVMHVATPVGIFVIGEAITGAPSLATGIITAINGRELSYTPTFGTFSVADIVTGVTSTATASIVHSTVYNSVGQVFKTTSDNINGLQLTLRTSPVGEVIDSLEQPTSLLMQSQWVSGGGGIPVARDGSNISTLAGSNSTASMRIDHSAPDVYMHLISHLHLTVTAGTFVNGETITGATSAATAVITGIDTASGIYQVSSVVGIFTAAEIVTGTTSLATGTTTTLQIVEDLSMWETISFDMMVSSKAADQVIIFTISDGVNTASSAHINNSVGQFYNKTINIRDLSLQGLPLAVDITAITSYSFTTSRKFKASYMDWIDNIRAEGFAGTVNVSLYDMGATSPVSGTTTIASGVPKTLFGTGAPTAIVPLALNAGEGIYRVNGFEIGNQGDNPANAPLIVGNYYSLVLDYVDTDVTVLGADFTAGIDSYPDGFMFNSPSLLGATSIMTSPSAFHDMAFLIDTSIDSYLQGVSVTADAMMEGAGVLVVLEDNAAHTTKIIDSHPIHPVASLDTSALPIHIPAKALVELYYTDSADSAVSLISLDITTTGIDAGLYAG